MRKPGIDSSLSSVPPVWPSPRPGHHRHRDAAARDHRRQQQRHLVADAAGGVLVGDGDADSRRSGAGRPSRSWRRSAPPARPARARGRRPPSAAPTSGSPAPGRPRTSRISSAHASGASARPSRLCSMSAGITIRGHPSPDPPLPGHRFAARRAAGARARRAAGARRRSTDHVALGAAAMQVHDLPTALAHYEAALALDSTAYEANWRASIGLLDKGEQIPDSVKSPERDSLYARAERPGAPRRRGRLARRGRALRPGRGGGPGLAHAWGRRSGSGARASSATRRCARSRSTRATTAPTTSWAGGTRRSCGSPG